MSSPQAPAREALSSFMDGEMAPDGIDAVVKACCSAEDLREDWTIYHCIGDALRSDDMAAHSSKLTHAISARLADEPFLLGTPRRAATHVSMRRAASMAAAVAGVAVVAYVALPRWNGVDGGPAQMALVAGQSAVAPTAKSSKGSGVGLVAPAAAPAVSREFLAAHRQYSGGIAMQGMVGQARNVSLETGR